MRSFPKFIFIVYVFLLLGACSSTPTAPKKLLVTKTEKITLASLPTVKTFDHTAGQTMTSLPVYAQCQIQVGLKINPVTGLHLATDDTSKRVLMCAAEAVKNKANVLILPELSLSYPQPLRDKIIQKLKTIAKQHDMVIIAGSYYDENRYSRTPIIGKNWMELGYKIRPSFYEASPRNGLGMRQGKYLTVVKTKYGKIMPLICVDLISDAVNYQIRRLAAEHKIDVLANINYNPAAWEFLLEANSIVRRHPIFATVTNVSSVFGQKKRCIKSGDNGLCGGNTGVIANIRNNDLACPNCDSILQEYLPRNFLLKGHKRLAYDNVVATIPPIKQGLLVYKLNLNLKRIPLAANAPDQGYPPVSDLKFVSLN